MDLPPIHHQQEATSSSISTDTHHLTYNTTTSAEPRPIRSSARVRAAKQKTQTKGKGKERDSPSQDQFASASTSAPPQETSNSRTTRTTTSKRSRENINKGKAKELPEEIPTRSSKRPRKNTGSTSTPLTINEPTRDRKGKKRAIQEPDEEDTSPTKRPRTSGYSLRSSNTTLQAADMPRKSRSSTGAKDKATLKSKIAAAGSSRHEDEDVEMLDAEVSRQEHSSDEEDIEEHMDIEGAGAARAEDHEGDHHQGDMGDGDEDEDDEDDEDGDDGDAHPSDLSSNLAAGLGLPAGLDEAAALAIFGDYRQFGSYMMSLSSRLKTMLNNIKATADPTTRLLTLQELSELLSMSTEDTLAGSFQVEQFVKELVRILGGTGATEDDDGDDDDDDEQNEDAALAAALAMSTGRVYRGDENLEAQVLACRCLANLMEALPGVAHTVVYHGAIPVLCSKLIEISYIDLAEQTLSTMEKISEEFPSAIVREGGLAALLNYLDFFSIAIQRTALQAAANCCRNVSPDHFPMIRGVWPIIRGCLSYSDQRLVEYACSCVIRVIESYHRTSVENLESLVDADLIRAVNQLLLPAGGSPLIAQNTFTQLLRALATCAKASPKITMSLLEADIVDTLYQILTGVLPSVRSSDEQGDGSQGQGLGGGLADMAVMQNLAHRPKEQIDEALALVSELMPPLPKDGVFDHKGYTEKALARMIKAKAKADKHSARQAAAAATVVEQDSTVTRSAASSTTNLSIDAEASPTPSDRQTQETDESTVGDSAAIMGETSSTATAPVVLDRTELLRSKPVVVGRFMQLLVPILIDVYAASVATQVRMKSMTSLLKAVSFLDADAIKQVLMFVPVASFASSILSSKDHPHLVLHALQLVDLLLSKVSSLYKPAFRREGVFHEIETFAARQVTSSKTKDKDKQATEGSASTPTLPIPPIAPIPGFKKLSQTLDPEDAVTLRSRVIQFKYNTVDAGEDDADDAFEELRCLVERISAPKATEKELSSALWELADLFASPRTSVSSFELLQSGVVDGLLRFVTEGDRNVDSQRRKELFLEAFAGKRTGNLGVGQTPFSTLVKKLQESLTRMESFEVITVNQGSDDSKRSSPSLLARQMRLRLVAGDDSDIPRNLHNIVVSIHAIATFQALHDYLRPRVSGLQNGGSRLSGMLAALAASGFTSSRNDSDETLKPPKAAAASAGESSSSNAPALGRRRSQRLSAKNASTSAESGSGSESNQPAPSTSATAEPADAAPDSSGVGASGGESDAMLDSALEADFTDDEVDADVFDEEADTDNSLDKTVSVSVVEDGSKVVAQTPEGTRVATPNATTKDSSTSLSQRKASSNKPSYAAALKTKPTDWHLEFSMDDHVLPLDLTIYGAIHQHENRKKNSMSSSMLWQSLYTIKFRKVPGPAPTHENDCSKIRPSSPTLSSLPEDAPHAKILRLLRALYRLNAFESERSAFIGDKRNLPESAFVNNKLSAKLTRQLEEPMIVASSCLPDWALDLPEHFPFLFPFSARYNFLQSTSFGYARLILKWQSQQTRGQDNSRRDDQIAFLGRLQRQKVRVSRKHILESAMKVFELYGSSSSILEVEYFEEVGTGLGPTLEFYSLVSKEFARKDLKVWRDFDSSGPGVHVHHPNGLYPAPIRPEEIRKDGGEKRTHILRVVGQFVAKAMLDSRIIDMTFNKVFLKLILGEEVPLTIATLKLVDEELANSLLKIQNIVANKSNPTDKLSKKLAQIEGVNIEDLALDFTLPGYDIELKPGGRDISVTSENVQEYINEVLDAILGKGVQLQVNAFKEGFSKVFPVMDLKTFTGDELVMLFGNSDEDWSVETLSEALKADHGFNVESRAIRDLIEIMSEYDKSTRRAYLQFITGSPKLPIGGFRGLNPPLTVVRKPHEAPLTADDYLPSVMTCVNYLKLPDYSGKEVMREKLAIAMQEGVGSFHLS